MLSRMPRDRTDTSTLRILSRSGLAGILAFGAATVLGAFASAGERDVRELLEGVQSLGKCGLPGRVAAWGPDAFPVLLGSAGSDLKAPVVAAATSGPARLVAFGHNGYFGDILGEGDGWRLMENSLRWAANRPRGKLRVGVFGDGNFAAALAKRGMDAEVVASLDRLDKPPAFDVLCGDMREWSDADMARLDKFFSGGGGIVGGVTGWGWQQLNPTKKLARDNGGNRVARRFGLSWTDGTLEPAEDGKYHPTPSDLPWCHAPTALDALLAKSPPAGFGPREAQIASWTIAQVVGALPEDDKEFRPRLARLFGGRAAIVPTEQQPLKKDRTLERLQLSMECDTALAAAPTKVKALPAASAFPGAVPEKTQRVQRIVPVDLSVPRWHSTGLYAAAGDVVEVSLPAAAAARGLRLRIGSHTDDIAHHDAWRRAPRVSREEPLDAESVKVASPFGGLVYVVVPDKAPPEVVQVKLRNVLEAPRFVLGATEPAAWRERIRALPGPWAELETDRVILTIPSSIAREIDDPTAVLARWNVAMDAAADLLGIPAQRPSPERFVCDVQISAGYMHSGYPIMAHLDAAAFTSDPEKLCVDGWGPFHEVGHNHQVGAWTFEGTGEVTNNVFTLYMYEAACGKKPTDDERFTAEARTKRWKEQKDRKDAFERWKSDPFLALMLYVDLQQEFGWELYKQVFREYAAMKQSDLPTSDLGRRDEWLVRVSRAAGKDLGPLFTSWGLETSPEARQSLADLPVWLPAGRQ